MSIKDPLHLAIVAVLAIASGLAFATLYSVFTPPDTRLQTIKTLQRAPTEPRTR